MDDLNPILTVDYRAPDGERYDAIPVNLLDTHGWVKEWRLTVEVGGINYHSAFQEPITSPHCMSDKFDAFMMRQLAREVGEGIADAILTRMES